MRLNFWPFSVINGLRAKVDQQQQDIATQVQSLEHCQQTATKYGIRIASLSRELNELDKQMGILGQQFMTGQDARSGCYLIGGYSTKKSGPDFEAAVGREVVASGQLVVLPVPKEDQSNPDHKYAFRPNVQRNTAP